MIACTPSEAEVLSHPGPERFAAMSVTLLADSETPISIYRRLARGQRDAALLESVEGGELMGRYSFIIAGAEQRLTFHDGNGVLEREDGSSDGAWTREEIEFADPLEFLRDKLADWTVWSPGPLPRFHGGAVGYLGFDCIRYFEELPLPAEPGLGQPDGRFLFTREIYIYDHVSRRLTLVTYIPLDGDRAAAYARGSARLERAMERLYDEPIAPDRPWALGPAELAAAGGTGATELAWTTHRDRPEFEEAVRQAREAIRQGEIFQVVISQRLSIEADIDPLELYRALRALNPSPYMFMLRFEDFAVVGASPEVLVRLEDGEILLRPIAGTRPRGATPEEEAELEADLLADEKELAEHRMLVDLGRNDVGRVAAVGSVRMERPLHIERYSHVMHIVSDVRGQLEGDRDCFDVLRACFPAGTVSGAPKIRACELLSTLERERRGLYAGAVGYFGAGGNMDMCIAIRTLVVEPDAVHTQAGAGIVWDSDPEREYDECLHKARSALAAIRLAAARRHP
ncbi:MAG: anthranilate synthase component I [Myxococcota bacterium]|jgi:anthranilate synthase component 1|nr:anthranilate synthase component I [Myxococcota bacterium]